MEQKEQKESKEREDQLDLKDCLVFQVLMVSQVLWGLKEVLGKWEEKV